MQNDLLISFLLRQPQKIIQPGQLRDLESILLEVQMAYKTIANLVNRAGLVYSI
jgi:hypothetical protein